MSPYIREFSKRLTIPPLRATLAETCYMELSASASIGRPYPKTLDDLHGTVIYAAVA